MSADFIAGYISGAAGILIGNPLDIIKVRLQAGSSSVASASVTGASSPSTYASQFSSAGTLIRGATAPILGYGALNALLFVTYNRTSDLLNTNKQTGGTPNLWTTWIAGAVGGLATWAVSTPTELIKCRAQVSSSATAASSLRIAKDILRTEGIRGLYFGGVVTALRDSVGYGFYFWSYEISTRFMMSRMDQDAATTGNGQKEAAKVLLCGGLAGIVTWASIFPLDVIKTRVQTQILGPGDGGERTSLLGQRRLGAMEVARNAYRTEGVNVFFKGLAICSVRAFIVNAAQWAVYEWIMRELDPVRKSKSESIGIPT
ncbi:Mitochondrial carrier [Venustampulla echinocandica]|uniref:Mitochondrial carrier n=1 Tax=Venustampulla echinocandica TaxID=2656787 RepID=A0A370TDK0_9HELO|nr:Mitochondrial carrier [Venustampulla echinocandica]RDL32532.1 Mitochondrial carrier [Venustampulla echinocandica]